MKENLKNSEDFLSNHFGNKHGYSAPKKYLDTIEDEISASIFKENMGSENHFKIPNNYFHDFDENILREINKKNQFSFKQKVINIIPLAAAACVLLFLGLNSFSFSEKDIFSELNENDIEYWVDSERISTLDVAEIFENDIKTENEFALTDLKDENIEDYVLELNDTPFLNE